MLQAARRRLRDFGNVEVRRGELESLPIDDATLDAATLMLVLHHAPDPAVVLADVARTMRSGGRLLVTDMLPHDHEEYRQQMGHVWLGFSEEQMQRAAEAARTAAGFARASRDRSRASEGRRSSRRVSEARRCSPAKRRREGVDET